MGLSHSRLSGLEPGDMVTIEEYDYIDEAMFCSGITTMVTRVDVTPGGFVTDVRVEADNGRWNWDDHIEKIFKKQPIIPATEEELTAMLFNT